MSVCTCVFESVFEHVCVYVSAFVHVSVSVHVFVYVCSSVSVGLLEHVSVCTHFTRT